MLKPSLSIGMGDSEHDELMSRMQHQSVSSASIPKQYAQHHHHEDHPSPSCALPGVMRRLALFIDGMTRAMILPFGPSLVHRLVYGSSEKIQQHSWSGVAYYFAWVVAVYICGRWLGTLLSQQHSNEFVRNKERLPVYVSRLGGAAISLHIFTYGAGLASVKWLVAIRFLSAILAGLLCGWTNSIALPEDDWVYRSEGGKTATLEEERIDALRRREGYVDIASGTAKIYLTGFAVSILSGGLLFRKATKDSTFRALTGASQYSLSPLFLVGVAVTAEIILRGLFALARNPSAKEDAGTAGRVRGVVRRMVSDNVSERTGRDVVVAVESLTACRRASLSPVPKFHFQTLIEEDGDDASSVFSARYFDADAATFATRSRKESFTSIDEFFDCRSMMSGDVEGGHWRIATPPLVDETEVARYVDGKCQYADGSPAFVPNGDCAGTIPPNYLAFYNQNVNRARQAWLATQQWRREKQVWKIHTIPNPWFPKIKQAYPHFVHGHSKAGFPIVYEQPGRMNLKDLFRNGCGVADMVQHYTFFMEYIANTVCTLDGIRKFADTDSLQPHSSSWGIIIVMDVKGAGLSHLSGDVVRYLKQAGDINSSHYPMSMKRAFLVNSPFWLSGAWSGLKGILPESVQVDILSESKYLDALREFIDDDQIPQEYGGSSPYPLGEHPYEVQLRQLVEGVKDDVDDDGGEGVAHTHLAELPPPPRIEIQFQREPEQLDETVFSPSKAEQLYEPDSVRTPPPFHPVRRRVGSVDRESRRRKSIDFTPTPTKTTTTSFSAQRDVFIIVSVTHVLWSFAQGAIEVAIPLWILSPTVMGGLGYSPSRSGVSLFCACLVLLWTLRTKPSKLVSKIPSNSPLRAFRIGLGSEAALLALLGCVSTFSS